MRELKRGPSSAKNGGYEVRNEAREWRADEETPGEYPAYAYNEPERSYIRPPAGNYAHNTRMRTTATTSRLVPMSFTFILVVSTLLAFVPLLLTQASCVDHCVDLYSAYLAQV